MMKDLIINLIKGYKILISPLLVSIAGNHGCKFRPTCAEVTISGMEEYGILRGLGIGWSQLRKCY